MDMSQLRERLVKSVEGLDEMINNVMMEAMANDIDPYGMRNASGAPLLAPLIVSQTSALLMLANMPEE